MALEHDDYDDEYADEIEDLDDIDVDFVEDPIDPATYTMPQTRPANVRVGSPEQGRGSRAFGRRYRASA